ncbi:MAG: hypothetical protein KBG75_00795 [Pseudomonadales bacterium]|nr:hypothetical protein [Pseudomonadales bacterium]
MDHKRFAELAGAYGAERRRWPEQERALYDTFADTLEGRMLLADAEQLDHQLDGWLTTQDDEARVASIVAAATLQPDRPFRLAWLSTGFAACVLLGFVLGFLQVSTDGDDATSYDLLLGSSTIEELL